jgi:predicted phosphate transport protein (TIGR00153 family)
MDDGTHTRAPIAQTIRKSPFRGLQEHFKYVRSGITTWKKAISAYLDEDYSNFQKLAVKVDKNEQKADDIKGNIRNHLPSFIFLPVSKSDFLMLLKETDGILDGAQDVVVLMEMRKTKIPKNLKKDFKLLIEKALEPVETLEHVMDLFKVILESSFGGKPREEIKGKIHKIHHLEHESDKIEKKISKELFNSSELDPISVIHLLKIVDRMGHIPDHAENAADRIRAMLAK